MKIKKPTVEPRLRKVAWYTDSNGDPVYKDTPKIKSSRRLQLELKELRQPPKKNLESIIVPD